MNRPSQRRTGMLVKTLQPEDTDGKGRIDASALLRIMRKTAEAAAWKYAGSPVVPIHVEPIGMHRTIRTGEVVTARAIVVYTEGTTMEVEVTLQAGESSAGMGGLAAAGFFTLVALDAWGKPTPVIPWMPETAEDLKQHRAAAERRQRRMERAPAA